jgi:hypothetical protein
MFKKIVAYILLITLMSVIYLGCNSNYLIFDNSKGMTHFRFEYPNTYEVVQVSNATKTALVILNRKGISLGSWADKEMGVVVYELPLRDPYGNVRDAKSKLEIDIKILKEQIYNFQVLESSQVLISGLVGNQIVLQYDAKSLSFPLPDPVDLGPGDALTIERRVYFDQGGLIWMVRIKSTEQLTEEARADFEQVIRTFKILK